MKQVENALNEELIKVAKSRLLEDRNLAAVLMETLSIGKEAAYRRIRKEVSFTFHEAVLIARALGISLDQVSGNSAISGTTYSLNTYKADNPFDYFNRICNGFLGIYTYMKDDPTGVFLQTANALHFIHYSHYEMLTRFRLCRWLHQYYNLKDFETMATAQIPSGLIHKMKELSDMQRQIQSSCFLFDSEVFYPLVREVKYFYELNLMSSKELDKIKEDLFRLIEEYEDIAYRGTYPNGNPVQVYLSNIPYEAPYTYMEKLNFQLSIFHLYHMDYIQSHHPEVCMMQKNWIESLKRYSTLISQCGEKQRLAFFDHQRKALDILK